MNVQAVINNISFPRTLGELRHYVFNAGRFDAEEILDCDETEWTMPKWAMPNDIVFFYHAKTALARIRRLELELMRSEPADQSALQNALQRARSLYSRIGGKIFAVGRVLDRPFYDALPAKNDLHWNSKVFAAIGDIFVLDNPIDLDSFSDFIFLSRQSAITAVLKDDFTRLKELILSRNPLPDYVIQSQATPVPLIDMNEQNWLEIANKYRRSFFLEIQFRKYYVDYLLPAIGDRKKFYSECECYRGGTKTGRADNCIWIDGRLCFVEVKLNIHAVDKIEEQLEKYCFLDEVSLDKKMRSARSLIPDRVIVIDTERIYIFDAETEMLEELIDLDDLKNSEDLVEARKAIVQYLQSMYNA